MCQSMFLGGKVMFETKTVQETKTIFKVYTDCGLTEKEAAQRLEKYGKNVLKQEPPKGKMAMILEQLNDPLIFVLFAAAAISMVLHQWGDGAIIVAVICLNAVAGVVQEGKAIKAMEALEKMTAPTAVVRRGKKLHQIEAAFLVPGDVVVLEAGRRVPADLRLIDTSSLKIEEASLTGESIGVHKDALFVATAPKIIGDCKNMAFMSTNVTNGRGEGIVVATGMNTQIGKIAGMISKSKKEMTPLQHRLADLGRLLSFIAVGLCILLFVIAVIQKRNILEMFITAISLAVAAVPEGLPAVVTIVLALSVSRMVKANTIIRRLPCVETLGCVSVVCSDKTGTLTENKMVVKLCYTDMKLKPVSQLDKDNDRRFLQGFMWCNDAILPDFGDPTELALAQMSRNSGLKVESVQGKRIGELPFDSVRKMMSTLNMDHGRSIQFTKGSADELLKRCNYIYSQGRVIGLNSVHKQDIQRAMKQMADQALRVLGLAMREDVESIKEQDMIFLGLAAMEDPPRKGVAESVELFEKAGVRTVMITGDHKDTAFAIAKQIHIADKPEQCISGQQLEVLSDTDLAKKIDHLKVFSRVSPAHKVRIVKAFKTRGHIVAMTGDGVNDAPSLKAADIGIAMGKNGTDVARSASDMILTDDCFSTIEKAIEEGRGIYANIKKSVFFLLSSNFGEIMTMFTAMLMGIATPLKASHILWINLITDSLPALALGVDQNDTKTMMSKGPRPPKESLFANGGLALTIFYGALIAAISLTAFLKIPYSILRTTGQTISIGAMGKVITEMDILNRCQTYAFTVLGISQLFHALGMRNTEISLFKMKWRHNPVMILAVVIGLALQIIVTEVPYFIGLFGTCHLNLGEWGLLLLLSAIPAIAHEILALF